MSSGPRTKERITQVWGGYERWSGEPIKLFSAPKKRWRVYCGEGRFEPTKRNAAYHRGTGVAVNFQIIGAEESVENFEISVTWDDSMWSLMFHNDPHPDREHWPSHPRFHIQFQPPAQCEGSPPFVGWRIPFAEDDPVRLLEFLVHRLDLDAPGGQHPGA